MPPPPHSLVWPSLGLAFALASAADDAFAANRHALLIGVGEYDQPLIPDLAGPPNDVELFAEVLRPQGFAGDAIKVLSDRSGERPTHAAIEEAFAGLARRVSAGDEVVVMMGGHGSRQPDGDDDDDEFDGLDEIFLPSDAGEWSSAVSSVERAIVDDDLAAWIGRIAEAGARVWLILDSCHSESGARNLAVARFVDPEALGVPIVEAGAASRSVAAGQAQGDGFDPVRDGRFVAFYASQGDEETFDKPLPLDAPPDEQRSHGIFSWELAQALATRPDMTFRQALDRVRQSYRNARHFISTPTYEATPGLLDEPIVGGEAQKLRQWPIEGSGEERIVSAGRLHRIDERTRFAMLCDPSADVGAGAPRLRPVQVDTLRTTLAFEDDQAAGACAKGAFARVIDADVGGETPVALIEGRGAPTPAAEAAVEALLGRLEDDPDVRVVEDAKGAALRLLPEDGRLWVAAGEAVERDATPSVALPDENAGIASFAEQAAALVRREAGLARLFDLAAALAIDPFGENLEVTALARRTDGEILSLLEGEPPTLAPGDRIEVRMVNRAPKPIDVTAFAVDAEGCVASWFPRLPEGNNRIPPEGSRSFGAIVTGDPIGREHFLLLGVAAEPNADRVELSSLGGNCQIGERGLATILRGSLSEITRGFGRETETAPQGVSRVISFKTASPR